MIWNPKRRDQPAQRRSRVGERRNRRAERLEPRQLLAADPIHLGVVYLETDYLESDLDVGSDSRGDRFIVSFTGGAPDTALSELRIRTDKDGDGISVGDPIFDTLLGGRGKNGAHSFRVLRMSSSDGETIDAVAEVADGGQELVLRLSNFRAGDRLEFSIDVDEVLRNAVDLAIFNDRLDVITSGQEFQDSILEATFDAPRFETAHADAIFLNDFGDPASTHGLDLPADEGPGVDSRPNRSAAAVASTKQTPKPIEISGHVWIDNDLDEIRESDESMLPGVEITLWRQDDSGNYVDTGLRSVTDSQGRYVFPKSLGLMPGTYRVVQTQPEGLLSVAAVPGRIDSASTNIGVAESINVLGGIEITEGDSVASDYDFAEAERASLSGRVYVDSDDDGELDPDESGIAGVELEVIPIHTIAPQTTIKVTTSSSGHYAVTGLVPGEYEVIQVQQPTEYLDGTDSAGTVAGAIVGFAENPGDRITAVALAGGAQGLDYNFGEIPLGTITGSVYLAAPGQDCVDDHDALDATPLADVALTLLSDAGEPVATTNTDSLGQYRFDHVRPGIYQIVESTPASLLDGRSHAGRIGDVAVGSAVDGGLITNVTMSAGGIAEEFNFCEVAPASVEGTVYHDRDNDGTRTGDEEPIAGVTIQLFGSDGELRDIKTTDNDGRYRFEGLPPGQYSLVEVQPDGWLDGRDSVGSVDGIANGTAANDQHASIALKQGQRGTDYNFGEQLPASLSGMVHADVDGDCVLDPEESTIAGVTVRLMNESDEVVAETKTDADGRYVLEGLVPGTYTLVQFHPPEFLDGGAKPGTAGGDVVGSNRIEGITLSSGERATDYDFCEVPSSSIGGRVWSEPVFDGEYDTDDQVIGGVTIELIDDRGQVVGTTRTDDSGHYQFTKLPPGDYSVREIQPSGLFHGGEMIGTANGHIDSQDFISGIRLDGGTIATGYDFAELPPASLSGFVFQDGDAITLAEPPDPSSLREYRDGLRSEDDRGLQSITLELRDEHGLPFDSGQAIAGVYPDGPIRVTTDARGYYQFHGLPGGVYHVYQLQPSDLVDSLDTAGTAGGFAVNAADRLSPAEADLVESLSSDPNTDPRGDAILNIRLVGGQISEHNNFSEIELVDPPPEIPFPPAVPVPPAVQISPSPPVQPPELIAGVALGQIGRSLAPRIQLASFDQPAALPPRFAAGNDWAVSWHLSVINGGYPRGTLGEGVIVRNVSTPASVTAWQVGQHTSGRWVIGEADGSMSVAELTLGEVNAIALAGDFDGDGSDEAVIYVAGQWFVDVNGNGHWDAGDLWIGLGSASDRPVVGDWDGDGKDDVGIYGRQWRQDPERIIRDPGLPDPANTRRRSMDPAAVQRAMAAPASHHDDQPRWLRRGHQGELRADVVDHVFQYGQKSDEPVVGDWNGDGIDQVAVFNSGNWLLDHDGDGRRSPGDEHFSAGRAGDVPIAGDFNGDGIDEIGIVRGQWWIIDTDGDRRFTGNDLQIHVPRDGASSQPVVADWDGDGTDEPGYYQTR